MTTVENEQKIAHYVRDVALNFETKLPGETRQRALDDLKTRIRARLNGGKPDDLDRVLDDFGPADEQARRLAESASRGTKPESDRMWLGVCEFLADESGLPLYQVRAGALILGLLTGPLALLGYLGLFVAMSVMGKAIRLYPADGFRIATQVGITLAVAIAVYWVGYLCIWTAAQGYVRLVAGTEAAPVSGGWFPMPSSAPNLGSWQWLLERNGRYLFYAILLCVPLSVLGGLPLSKGWDYSVRRLSHALLALYGVIAAAGVAYYVTGLILLFVEVPSDLSTLDLDALFSTL